MGIEKYAILNDVHFPYEGKCYEQALNIMQSWKDLAGIYLNGDIAEIESVSSHPRSRGSQQYLLDEIEYTNVKFDELEDLFPGIPIHYICGNHEFRMYRFIRDVAPQLWGMLQEPKLFRFDERPDFKFYDYGPTQLVPIGKCRDFYARHEPLAGGQNHAKGTAEKSVVSIIYGHTHTHQTYIHKKFGPEPIVTKAFSNGFLGDISQPCFDYRGTKDNWQNGFSLVECDTKTKEWECRFIYL